MSHVERIKEELRAAGMTSYGLSKMESKYLPKVIHEDEHIGGVVYGQEKGGTSSMLVATDKRVIYLDRKPFFSTIDELTYDVISGVREDQAAGFSSVVLYTRIANYSLKFVNRKCAQNFMGYIEKRRLTKTMYQQSSEVIEQDFDSKNTATRSITKFDEKTTSYLKSHDLAVLSTVDRRGNVHGAVVYYATDSDNNIFVLTKSSTANGRNVFAFSQVALTIHEQGTLETLQIQGQAQVETNQSTKQKVFDEIVKQRSYSNGEHFPPITKIKDGTYMVICITPTAMSYRDYSKPI